MSFAKLRELIHESFGTGSVTGEPHAMETRHKTFWVDITGTATFEVEVAPDSSGPWSTLPGSQLTADGQFSNADWLPYVRGKKSGTGTVEFYITQGPETDD